MTINYTLTEDDYVEFNAFHIRNMASVRKQRMMLNLSVPIILLCVAIIYLLLVRPVTFVPVISMYFIICLIWVLALSFFFGREVKKQIRSKIAEDEGNLYTGDCVIALGEDRIIGSNNFQITEAFYNNIERVSFDQNRLYIYKGDFSAFIIPHNAFDNSKHEDEFIKIIKDKAGIV